MNVILTIDKVHTLLKTDLFNQNITFYISLNKYIKLINSFGLGRHLLRKNIVTSKDVTLGCLNHR